MRKSTFTEEQIVFAMRQAENAIKVEEVCLKLGVTEHSSIGTFDIGAFEHSSIRALEHWSIRAFEHWNIGTLEHWSIGTLEHSSIGTLSH